MTGADVSEIAIRSENAAPRTKPSNYPEPFASMMSGRIKRPLGDPYGQKNFGVTHRDGVPYPAK